MSLYSKYIAEREGKEIVEYEHGFATYSYHEPDICYIEDIYVDTDMREKGYAKTMADVIATKARANDCTILLGSVDIGAFGADDSVKVLYGYGMKISHIKGNIIFFKKEL